MPNLPASQYFRYMHILTQHIHNVSDRNRRGLGGQQHPCF
jgi:hypothetical protein